MTPIQKNGMINKSNYEQTRRNSYFSGIKINNSLTEDVFQKQSKISFGANNKPFKFVGDALMSIALGTQKIIEENPPIQTFNKPSFREMHSICDSAKDMEEFTGEWVSANYVKLKKILAYFEIDYDVVNEAFSSHQEQADILNLKFGNIKNIKKIVENYERGTNESIT